MRSHMDWKEPEQGPVVGIDT